MKYFSLFSGIGGFECGFPENWECVGYSEINKYAIKIYEKHFPEHKNFGDATKINVSELPDFDLLCAGFPCQAFSTAGKRAGFKDTRGTLFFEICRIAGAKRPRYLLLENVRGLLSHDEGNTFQTILKSLDELGYDCEWQMLNSKHWLPQNRPRVFIVGCLTEGCSKKIFPIIKKSNLIYSEQREAEKRIREISLTLKPRDYETWNGTYINHGGKIRRLTPLECERLQGFPDGWTEEISDSQRYKCLGNAVTVNVIKEIAINLEL